uniref:ZAD domain-containing protein n=1 Tax=Branchiostoma floridae TaxID=7739 RepID=C3Y827_BRAFL|eukprot:XP_002607486.1 hypothetical protein BRAFLDRAFT_69918 [Branchiostoma floridae]
MAHTTGTPRKECEDIVLSGIPDNECANCGKIFDENTRKKRRNIFGKDADVEKAETTIKEVVESFTGVNIVSQSYQPSVFVCAECFTVIKSFALANKRCMDAREKFQDRGKNGFLARRQKRTRSTPGTPGKVTKRRRQLFSPGTTPRKSSTSPSTFKVSLENKIRNIGPQMTSIVKPLLDYKYSTVANAVCKHEKIKPFILTNVLSVLNKEAQAICSPAQPSILRSSTLAGFNISNITKELEDRAPTITRVLRVISSPTNETVRTRNVLGTVRTRKPSRKAGSKALSCIKRKVTVIQRQQLRKKQQARRQPIIATSAAALFRARNRAMSAMQTCLGISLFKCHASAALYKRMKSCGVTVSHKQTLRAVDQLSKNHDQEVHRWKKELETPVSPVQQGETPVSHVQQGETPVSYVQRGETPVSHVQRGETPVSYVKQGETPVSFVQRGETPVSHVQRGETPVSHDQQGETPVSYVQRGETPVSHIQQGETPVSYVQQGETPVSFFQWGETPVSYVQGGETPVSHVKRGETPVSHVQQGGTPVSFFQRGETPVSHVQQGETPVSFVQRGETPVSHVQRGETPVSFVQRGETPVSYVQRGETLVSHVQRGETPVSYVQQGETQVSYVQRGETPVSYVQRGETPVSFDQQGETKYLIVSS